MPLRIGIPNAKVFPLPVSAAPRISRLPMIQFHIYDIKDIKKNKKIQMLNNTMHCGWKSQFLNSRGLIKPLIS